MLLRRVVSTTTSQHIFTHSSSATRRGTSTSTSSVGMAQSPPSPSASSATATLPSPYLLPWEQLHQVAAGVVDHHDQQQSSCCATSGAEEDAEDQGIKEKDFKIYFASRKVPMVVNPLQHVNMQSPPNDSQPMGQWTSSATNKGPLSGVTFLYPSVEAALTKHLGEGANTSSSQTGEKQVTTPDTVRQQLSKLTSSFYATQSHDDMGICGTDADDTAREVAVAKRFVEAGLINERVQKKQCNVEQRKGENPLPVQNIVVELGCGQGRMTEAVMPLLKSGCGDKDKTDKEEHHLVLVDAERSFLDKAVTKAEQCIAAELRPKNAVSVHPVCASVQALLAAVEQQQQGDVGGSGWHRMIQNPTMKMAMQRPPCAVHVTLVFFGVSQYLCDETLLRLFDTADRVVLHEDASRVVASRPKRRKGGKELEKEKRQMKNEAARAARLMGSGSGDGRRGEEHHQVVKPDTSENNIGSRHPATGFIATKAVPTTHQYGMEKKSPWNTFTAQPTIDALAKEGIRDEFVWGSAHSLEVKSYEKSEKKFGSGKKNKATLNDSREDSSDSSTTTSSSSDSDGEFITVGNGGQLQQKTGAHHPLADKVLVEHLFPNDGSLVRHSDRFDLLLRCSFNNHNKTKTAEPLKKKRHGVWYHQVDTGVAQDFFFFPHSWMVSRE